MFVYFALLFFFKQKTAYEMRISDSSSDVCSSDLAGGQRIAGIIGPPTLPVMVAHSPRSRRDMARLFASPLSRPKIEAQYLMDARPSASLVASLRSQPAHRR